MMQSAGPIGPEERGIACDPVSADKGPSRPAACGRSPRSIAVFWLKVSAVENAVWGQDTTAERSLGPRSIYF